MRHRTRANRPKTTFSDSGTVRTLGVNPSPRANDGVTTTGRGNVLSGSGRLVVVQAEGLGL